MSTSLCQNKRPSWRVALGLQQDHGGVREFEGAGPLFCEVMKSKCSWNIHLAQGKTEGKIARRQGDQFGVLCCRRICCMSVYNLRQEEGLKEEKEYQPDKD